MLSASLEVTRAVSIVAPHRLGEGQQAGHPEVEVVAALVDGPASQRDRFAARSTLASLGNWLMQHGIVPEWEFPTSFQPER